jgi:DNA-binding transcriptional ArsR family regulator
MNRITNIAIERPLVLQVLEGREPRLRSELETALGDVEPSAIGDALEALEAEGVLCISREQVWASRCIRHLDKLGLIAI